MKAVSMHYKLKYCHNIIFLDFICLTKVESEAEYGERLQNNYNVR